MERTDDESIDANGLNGAFAEIEFDIPKARVDGGANQLNEQRKHAVA